MKNGEVPLWFSMLLSLFGVGALYMVLLLRIDLPAAYPLIGLLMGAFPTHLIDRTLKRNSNGGGK